MRIKAIPNAHSKFRQTKQWIEFRTALVMSRGSRCEICGIHKKGLQVHHKVPSDYQNLDPANFSVLCARCHQTVETLAKRLKGKKADMILNLPQWMALYGPHLPRDTDSH